MAETIGKIKLSTEQVANILKEWHSDIKPTTEEMAKAIGSGLITDEEIRLFVAFSRRLTVIEDRLDQILERLGDGETTNSL